MQTFQKLKKLRSFFASIPGIKTCKDFDIAIEIGHYQHLGTPLTMKQLMLLNIAPPATMRRHLNKMVREGTVLKHTSTDDMRIVYFTLSDSALDSFTNCLEQIKYALSQSLTQEPVSQ